MSKKTKLKGPWQTVHTVIWLIGLAILAWQDWWWPGILVLIAISMVAQVIIQRRVPDAFEEEVEEEKVVGQAPAAPAMATTAVTAESVGSSAAEATAPTEEKHPTQRLPSECPKCSAPIRGQEARWTGRESADCPYCGANLPLRQEKI
jgi:hypothetical protein